jgi:hypothetical protein
MHQQQQRDDLREMARVAAKGQWTEVDADCRLSSRAGTRSVSAHTSALVRRRPLIVKIE